MEDPGNGGIILEWGIDIPLQTMNSLFVTYLAAMGS